MANSLTDFLTEKRVHQPVIEYLVTECEMTTKADLVGFFNRTCYNDAIQKQLETKFPPTTGEGAGRGPGPHHRAAGHVHLTCPPGL